MFVNGGMGDEMGDGVWGVVLTVPPFTGNATICGTHNNHMSIEQLLNY